MPAPREKKGTSKEKEGPAVYGGGTKTPGSVRDSKGAPRKGKKEAFNRPAGTARICTTAKDRPCRRKKKKKRLGGDRRGKVPPKKEKRMTRKKGARTFREKKELGKGRKADAQK